MRHIYKALVLSLTIVLFTGCAKKMVSVNIPDSEVMSNKAKAYVVFSKPYNFWIGATTFIDVAHFDNKTFNSEFVAFLAPGERAIYPVDVGDNYFYTHFLAKRGYSYTPKKNLLHIKAESGKVYYVNFSGNISTSLPLPKVYTDRRLKFFKELKEKKCSQATLNKYLFKLEKSEEEEEVSLVNKIDNYTSITNFHIECDGDKIVKVSDVYYTYSVEELNDAKLVKPTATGYNSFIEEKEEYEKSIQNLYPVWKIKYKNLPLTTEIFLDIIKEFDKTKEFDEVRLKSLTKLYTSDGKVDKFNENLNSKFEPLLKSGDNILIIEYRINYYDLGDIKNPAVINVDIFFKDKDNALIGSIKLSQITPWGNISSGIGIDEDIIIDSIYNYTLYNYIK